MEKVSCICITYNRSALLAYAIKYFFYQTHLNKNLIILFQSDDQDTKNFIMEHPEFDLVSLEYNNKNTEGYNVTNIRSSGSLVKFIQVPHERKLSLGMKRNIALAQADGDYICVWDDDDWYSKHRISNQLAFMKFSGKRSCTLASILLHDKSEDRLYVTGVRAEGWEGSLLCERSIVPEYKNLNKQEDTPVIHELADNGNLCVMEEPGLYVYNVHLGNVSGNKHFDRILQLSLPSCFEDYPEYNFSFSESLV